MMRFGKCIVVILLLLSAKMVFASTLISESWEAGWGDWDHPYGGASIVSDSTAPSGLYSLRFKFPSGMDGGNAPDIVTAYISGKSELYIQYYFKYSSNWVNHEVEQKHLFVWGGKDNFYTARGLFSDEMAFDLQGPGGSEVLQSNGINIQNNRWYKVTMHIIKNSADTSNGTAQMWLDDALIVNRTGIRYWNSGASFDQVAFSPVWGGMGGNVPSTQYLYVDGLQVQTTPIGTTPAPAPQLIPVPPSGLSIR